VYKNFFIFNFSVKIEPVFLLFFNKRGTIVLRANEHKNEIFCYKGGVAFPLSISFFKCKKIEECGICVVSDNGSGLFSKEDLINFDKGETDFYVKRQLSFSILSL